MVFTSELESMAGREWRLQKDGSWRKLERNFSLHPTDFTTNTPKGIPKITLKSMELGGVTYDIDPGHWPSQHAQLSHCASVFRKGYPAEPRLEQLQAVIAAGDDRTNNVLILNVNGLFELRQSPPFNQLLVDPSIIVRHESYCAGNDYVGPMAAKEDDFLYDEFVTSLEIWKEHLVNHQTQHYADMHTMASEPEIRRELEEIEKNWVPDF